MGHFVHSCRRDLDITYIVFNNENYALTTGQASPTTPVGAVTKTTPLGNLMAPLDAVELAKHAGCSYAVHAIDTKFGELKETIKAAISHKGFALIDVSQACPSYKRW